MRPLLIITLPEGTDTKTYDSCIGYFEKSELNKDYDILVISGAKANVYYPYRNWLKFYYFKLKAWLILKITKSK